MQIGIYGGNIRRGAGIHSIIDEVHAYQDQGFYSYWFPQVGSFDSLTMIALAGQQAKSIRFGTAVVPTYPRHPNVLAQQAATVNAVIQGRLTLGVGPSHANGIKALGLEYLKPAKHMREYVTILRALTSEGRVSFEGEFYRMRTGFQIPDNQPLAIVMSALAPLMLKTAGEVADGTVTWMVGTQTVKNHTIPHINAAAEAAGRAKPRVVVGLPICVHDDIDEAKQRAIQIFKGYGALPNYRRQLDQEGLKEAGEIAITGNEAAVEAQIRDVFAAGATEVIANIYPTGNDGAKSFARTQSLLKKLL